MKKRVLAILLTLTMVMTFMPTLAFATEVESAEEVEEVVLTEPEGPDQETITDGAEPESEGEEETVVEEKLIKEANEVAETETIEKVSLNTVVLKSADKKDNCGKTKKVAFYVGKKEYDVQSVRYGWLKAPEAPKAKKGYHFVCWNVYEKECGKWVEKPLEFNKHGYVKYNGRYDKAFAKFAANEYTVHFDGNGATSGTMEDMNFVYDEARKLTPNAFVNDGHVFLGWATKAGGDVVYFDGQWVKNLTSKQGKTVTLYAVWQAVSTEVTVTYNDGIDEAIKKQLHINVENMPEGKTIKTGDSYTVSDMRPVAHVMIDGIGYFELPILGWTDGENFYAPGDVIGSVLCDTELTALWNSPVYGIAYFNNVKPGEKVDRSGIKLTDYFYFTTKGKKPLPTVTKEGYHNDGWLTNPCDPESVIYEIKPGEWGFKCLFANWVPNEYTVKFLDGFGGTIQEKTQKYNEDTVVPANPTKKGYKFKGWSPVVSEKVTENATYVATWEIDKTVATGDSNDMMPYGVAAIVALVAIAGLISRRKRTN